MNITWKLAGKVSIVIPCFNHAEMLREALESVEVARNLNLAEVIIVNDGSTDPETCAYFEELSNSTYKIVHQENRGLGPARNAGIRVAQGEFILPLDNDNRIRELYLKEGVEFLLKHPEVGVVFGDVEYFGEKSGRERVPELDLRRIVRENYIDACALYRRSAWQMVNGYDEQMPWMGWEDWDFWMRVALCGWQFVHLDEIAFDYRVRAGSMVQQTNVHSFELSQYIFEKPQNRPLRIIKDQQKEIERLLEERNRLLKSTDYRAGHAVINLARKVKRVVHGK